MIESEWVINGRVWRTLKSFGNDRCVLYHDSDGDYTTVYIFKKSLTYIYAIGKLNSQEIDINVRKKTKNPTSNYFFKLSYKAGNKILIKIKTKSFKNLFGQSKAELKVLYILYTYFRLLLC